MLTQAIIYHFKMIHEKCLILCVFLMDFVADSPGEHGGGLVYLPAGRGGGVLEHRDVHHVHRCDPLPPRPQGQVTDP